MTERSRFWDGSAVGDAVEAPYDAATEFAQVLMSIASAARLANRGGVFGGELNQLAVVSGVGQITVDTGRAMVYGNWYENDALQTIPIGPSAGPGNRIDRVLLRKSWATQQVRLVVSPGTPGVPALNQVAGTTWEIPLARLTVTPAGAITVTDDREFLPIVPDGSITTVKIADDAVDDTKVGNRVPQAYRRQGGNATNWNLAGVNNYTPTTVRIQCGNIQVDGFGGITVTFPVPFSAIPLVFCQGDDLAIDITARVSTVTVNGFVGLCIQHLAAPPYHQIGGGFNTFNWLAIGPE